LPTVPLVNLVRLVLASSLVTLVLPNRWCTSASYCAAASHHAPLVPLVRLIVMQPFTSRQADARSLAPLPSIPPSHFVLPLSCIV
jgi:hypothetical protein